MAAPLWFELTVTVIAVIVYVALFVIVYRGWHRESVEHPGYDPDARGWPPDDE